MHMLRQFQVLHKLQMTKLNKVHIMTQTHFKLTNKHVLSFIFYLDQPTKLIHQQIK